MNIPPTLRTGFGDISEKSDKDQLELMATITSMITIFSEEALTLASHYTIYKNRIIVTTDDLIKGLKCRALDNDPSYWERPEIISKLKILYDEYIDSYNETDIDSYNETDIDSYNETDSDIDPETDCDIYPETDCDIESDSENNDNFTITNTMLHKMDNIDNLWLSYIPTNESEVILKQTIEKTENNFMNNEQ